jgi:purine-binding chemotaxis protein CheW
MKPADPPGGQILVFGLGEEFYGLEISRIQEVIPAPQLHYIPLAPQGLVGALNFHGSVVPVLDLGFWLGFPAARRDPRVIVLAHESCRLALAVQRIRRIVPWSEDGVISDEDRECGSRVRGLLEINGEIVNLLDVEGVTASLEDWNATEGGEGGS